MVGDSGARFVGMLLLLLLEVAAALVSPGRLVLLRHGESLWNKENRFTGWEDVPLTAAGEEEAREAANMLVTEQEDTRIDVVYTSVLCRALRTSELFVQEYANAHGEATPPPICTRWRLNERHYGVLQGLDKAETLAAWKDRAALKDWRLSFAGKPPPMQPDHPYYSRAPARLERLRAANAYGRPAEDADGGEPLLESDVPLTESIADTVVRVRPFWVDELLPSILAGQTALVVGHANCLRALVSCIQSNIDVSATRTMNTHQLSPRSSTAARHPRAYPPHVRPLRSRRLRTTRSHPSGCRTPCRSCTSLLRMARHSRRSMGVATSRHSRHTTSETRAWSLMLSMCAHRPAVLSRMVIWSRSHCSPMRSPLEILFARGAGGRLGCARPRRDGHARCVPRELRGA